MKVKLITISIVLLLVMVFACGCIPVMEKLGLVNPTNEEQLSPEKGGPPDGLVKVLIGFKEKPGPPEQALVKGLGGKIKYTYNLIPAIAASVPELAIEALKKNPNITDVELDSKVYALQQEIPWGVDRIDAEVVRASTDGNKGTGVKVAIIDTGIDKYHEDLTVAGGKSFVDYTDDFNDDDGHGTHVAGIVAALDNGIGVVGVAPAANLYALKALDSNGSGYVSDVVYAIQWATDPNGNGYAEDRLDIINMSLGADRGNIFLKWACNLAYRDGLLLIAAAGNGGSVIYPAAYARVIAVSATDSNDTLASFSSTGSEVELAAPGVNINSTLPGNSYSGDDEKWSGTSMASPHVAGTAALVWAANPSWSNTEVRSHLQGTAEDISLVDTEQGYGLVDAENAVFGTTNGNNLPTQATGTIIGTVTDKNTGNVIEGAVVSADGFSDFTKADGTYTLNDMPVGTYTITVSAIGYIEQSKPAEVLKDQEIVVNFTLTPGTTPPAKVTGLTVITLSCVQLNLDWGANTEIGLDHYNVYRSTTSGDQYDLIASPNTNSYLDVGLTASTTYYYVISAVDLSGNEGEASNEASGTTSTDDLGPLTSDVVADPNPTNGATSVTLTADVSDATTGNSNIIQAEYFVNTVGADGSGTPMDVSGGAFDSPTEGVTASINVSSWADGQHTLYVHGQDTAGNWGATESVVLEITEAPSNIMYVESITFSAKKAGKNLFLYITVEVLLGDKSAVNGARVTMTLTDGTSSWNFSSDTGSDGTVKFTLKAQAGNYTATVTKVSHPDYAWDEDPMTKNCTLNDDGTVDQQ